MKKVLLISLLLLNVVLSNAQEQVLHMDSAVRYGTLENGLTYYIRYNNRSGQYLNMYLVQKTGALQEENSELGISHFLEHMSFDGSKDFPDRTAQTYLQKKGLVLGGNFGALTGVLNTEYYINTIPCYESGLIDSCLLMLHGISSNLSLNDEKINRQRDIILQEQQESNTPEYKIATSIISKAFAPNERYGTRFPIGDVEVIKHADSKTLRDFYTRWYRPDMQAIMVVGVVDVDEMEAKIKEMWKDVPVPSTPTPFYDYEVSSHKGIIPIVEIDDRGVSNLLSLYYKVPDLPKEKKGTIEDCKLAIEFYLTSWILDSRMKRIMSENRTKVYSADADYDDYFGSRWYNSYRLNASINSANWKEVLSLMISEIKQMRTFGIGINEFNQTKELLSQALESGIQKSNDLVNEEYFERLKAHFIEHEIVLDENESNIILKKCLDDFTLNDLNKCIVKSFTDDNIVVVLCGNNMSNVITEQELASLYKKYYDEAIVEAYDDRELSLIPASNKMDPPATIVSERYDSVISATRIELSNGAKILLRYSDIERDKVDLAVFSRGGASLFGVDNYDDYLAIREIVSNGGFGQNSADDLERYQSNNMYAVKTEMEINDAYVLGVASHKSFPKMVSHLRLLFDKPMRDEVYFQQQQQVLNEMYAQGSQHPEVAFADSLTVARYGKEHAIMSKKLYSYQYDWDSNKAYDMYEQYFSNIDNFTFVFVGDMNVEQMKEIAIEEIGSIPQCDKKMSTSPQIEVKIDPGMKQMEFMHDGFIGNQSRMNMLITISEQYTARMELIAEILQRILEERLNESLREQKGITYASKVTVSALRSPTDQFALEVDINVEEGKEELVKDEVYRLLGDLTKNGIDLQSFEVILSALYDSYMLEFDGASYPMKEILNDVMYGTNTLYDKCQEIGEIQIEDIKSVCRDLLFSTNVKTVIMKPSTK